MTTVESSIGTMPADWRDAVGAAPSTATLERLEAFVGREREAGSVYPEPADVFAGLRLTPYAAVRAVILGQDPYHRHGQAHGLAFSVPDGFRPLPPSLRNIRLELRSDVALALPDGGSLEPWARQGVLLLNTVLTVRQGQPGSHRSEGWEDLTDAIIGAAAAKNHPVAFLLWGQRAQHKSRLIDEERHIVLRAAHPSPLSARGFLGKGPFSAANEELKRRQEEAINWALS